MATSNGTHASVEDVDYPDGLPPPAPANTNGTSAQEVEDLSRHFNMSSLSPSTQAIHADDPLNVVDDVAPPIHMSTTFRYDRDPSQLRPYYENPEAISAPTTHVYSRHTTHSTSRFEKILGVLLKNPMLDILIWPCLVQCAHNIYQSHEGSHWRRLSWMPRRPEAA